MPNPTLISSYPVDGAVDVPTNINIVINLSTPLIASSVTTGTVYVVEQSTDTIKDALVSVSSSEITIKFAEALNDYTSYRVYLLGQDVDSDAGVVTAYDSYEMEETITVDFMTLRPHNPEEDLTEEDVDEDGLTDIVVTGISASGEIESAVYTKFEYVPDDSLPPDGTLMVSPTYLTSNQVKIKFTTDVNANIDESDIDVEVRPLINLRAMVSSPDTLQCNYNPDWRAKDCTSSASGDYCPDVRLARTKPSYSLEASGEYLIVTIDEDAYAYNQEIIVDLKSSVTSSADTGLQTLGEAKVYNIATGLFPFYAEIEAVRTELREFNGLYTDYAITKLIAKNSIEAWTLACMSFDICSPPWYAVDYALYKTVSDLYGLSQIKQLQHHNMSKKLGDFSVQYGNANRYPIPKENQTDEAVAELRATLRGLCGANTSKVTVKGWTAATMPWNAMRKRTWRNTYEGLRPQMANTAYEWSFKYPRLNEYWS